MVFIILLITILQVLGVFFPLPCKEKANATSSKGHARTFQIKHSKNNTSKDLFLSHEKIINLFHVTISAMLGKRLPGTDVVLTRRAGTALLAERLRKMPERPDPQPRLPQPRHRRPQTLHMGVCLNISIVPPRRNKANGHFISQNHT